MTWSLLVSLLQFFSYHKVFPDDMVASCKPLAVALRPRVFVGILRRGSRRYSRELEAPSKRRSAALSSPAAVGLPT